MQASINKGVKNRKKERLLKLQPWVCSKRFCLSWSHACKVCHLSTSAAVAWRVQSDRIPDVGNYSCEKLQAISHWHRVHRTAFTSCCWCGVESPAPCFSQTNLGCRDLTENKEQSQPCKADTAFPTGEGSLKLRLGSISGGKLWHSVFLLLQQWHTGQTPASPEAEHRPAWELGFGFLGKASLFNSHPAIRALPEPDITPGCKSQISVILN